MTPRLATTGILLGILAACGGTAAGRGAAVPLHPDAGQTSATPPPATSGPARPTRSTPAPAPGATPRFRPARTRCRRVHLHSRPAGRNGLDVHPHDPQSGGADIRRRRQRRRGHLDPGHAARRARTRHILPDRQLRLPVRGHRAADRRRGRRRGDVRSAPGLSAGRLRSLRGAGHRRDVRDRAADRGDRPLRIGRRRRGHCLALPHAVLRRACGRLSRTCRRCASSTAGSRPCWPWYTCAQQRPLPGWRPGSMPAPRLPGGMCRRR